MKTEARPEGKTAGRGIARLLAGPLVGIAVSILVLLVFAMIITYTDVGEGIIGYTGFIAGALGAFAAGFINARRAGRQGLVNGLVAGGIMFAALYIIGFIVSGSPGTIGNAVGMLLIIGVSSLIAGVLAINTMK